jgi:hypothetical protein
MDLHNSAVKSLTLRRFPPEVRLLIYPYALYFNKYSACSKSRVFLAALLGDPVLYNEAIEVYYEVNTFRLEASLFI